MNTTFNMLIQLIATAPGYQDSLPQSVRAVQESFMSGQHWIFWLCLLVPAAALIGSAGWWWQQHRRQKQRRIINDPEKLFEALLARVKLAEDEKNLLREVTRTSRLRHPAMSLLSPELLDISHRAWLAEKNHKNSPDTSKHIDDISISLYDQATPSGIQRIKETF